MMRYSLAATTILLIGMSPAFGQSGGGTRAKEIDIEGTYNCVGDLGSDKTYRGTTTITKKNDVYLIRWTIAKDTHEGTGIRIGDTLSVAWKNSQGDSGVVVYVIREKGKLEGKWAFFGDTRQFGETLSMDK